MKDIILFIKKKTTKDTKHYFIIQTVHSLSSNVYHFHHYVLYEQIKYQFYLQT